MEEAERRHEDEWSERLENESVRCLSPSFYKAHCRGGDSEQVTGFAKNTTKRTSDTRTA